MNFFQTIKGLDNRKSRTMKPKRIRSKIPVRTVDFVIEKVTKDDRIQERIQELKDDNFEGFDEATKEFARQIRMGVLYELEYPTECLLTACRQQEFIMDEDEIKSFDKDRIRKIILDYGSIDLYIKAMINYE